MKKMRGFTLIELLIVVAIIAILAAIAVPNFLEAQVRSKVSRVRSDQRSLALAIEAYFVDNNIYPAWAVGTGSPLTTLIDARSKTYNQAVVESQKPTNQGAGWLPNFQMRNPPPGQLNIGTLTTPLSYMTSYPADPFASNRGVTFSYYAVWPGDTRNQSDRARGGVGWILWSFGPDVDENKYQPGSSTPYACYDPGQSQPTGNDPVFFGGLIAGGLEAGTANARAFTYDPTNGTVSKGDVWRVKQ